MKRLIAFIMMGGLLLMGGCSEPRNPEATIEMDSGAKILIELYPDKAPNTVNNFIALANSGFYDGLKFHRISEGFMIQGGDPYGVGTGDPGYSIKGEFSSNGFTQNDISHQEGVISMARSSPPDSAGSQFFICDGDASGLDGSYAAFGIVIEGLETVKDIASQPHGSTNSDGSGTPAVDQIMKKVTVDTFGKNYPEPEKLS